MGSFVNFELQKATLHPVFKIYFALTGLAVHETTICSLIVNIITVVILIAAAVSDLVLYFVSEDGKFSLIEPFVYKVKFF